MEQKLIVLDIDGTLTEPGKNEPPASAVKAVRIARANGHRVVLCSGRNRGMLSPLLQYGFDGLVETDYNGSYTFLPILIAVSAAKVFPAMFAISAGVPGQGVGIQPGACKAMDIRSFRSSNHTEPHCGQRKRCVP